MSFLASWGLLRTGCFAEVFKAETLEKKTYAIKARPTPTPSSSPKGCLPHAPSHRSVSRFMVSGGCDLLIDLPYAHHFFSAADTPGGIGPLFMPHRVPTNPRTGDPPRAPGSPRPETRGGATGPARCKVLFIVDFGDSSLFLLAFKCTYQSSHTWIT